MSRYSLKTARNAEKGYHLQVWK